MSIHSIQSVMMPEANMTSGLKGSSEGSTSFDQIFKKTVGEVDELLKSSDQKAVALTTGKAENLHEAMISFEKAETAFKLLVQVRNKALEAYQDILRMQV